MTPLILLVIFGCAFPCDSVVIKPSAHALNFNREASVLSAKPVLHSEHDFGIMVDAGSSGTRVHMFRWARDQNWEFTELVPKDEDSHKFKFTSTLASYSENPADAGPALAKMISAAEPYIPEESRNVSLVFVKATAGIRLIESSKADSILDQVRQHLTRKQNCPFKFVSAEVISGEEESIFTYLTANYYLGKLSQEETVGTIEMGGASMQVAFRPATNILDHESQFYINGIRHSIYTKSYIRFGVDEAIARLYEFLFAAAPNEQDVASPCHQHGFTESIMRKGRIVNLVGAANVSKCIDVVHQLLGLNVECLMPPCALRGSYMAVPTGNFYALAGFFYTAYGLGLVGWDEAKALTINEVASARDAFCAKSLGQAMKDARQHAQFVERYCFLAVYQVETLTAFGFEPAGMSVTYSRKVQGRNFDWTTGAMLYETQFMPLNIGNRSNAMKASPQTLQSRAIGPKRGIGIVMAVLIAYFFRMSQLV